MTRKLSLFLLLVTFLPIAARSEECATIENVVGLDVNICFSVEDVGSGLFVLTTNSITGIEDIKAIHSIGWDTDAGFFSGPAGENWSHIQYDQHIDGFSSNLWSGQSTGTGNLQNGGLTSWTFSGNPGNDIVFQVQYGGDCSVWVSNIRANPNPGNLDVGCGSSTPIPEPASLTLLGTGLLGIAGMVRRKIKK